MAHNHPHNHSSKDSHNNSSKNIVISLILNAFFVVVEVVGGLWTNSIAILSDAAHDLGDTFALAITWGLQKKSQQKGDESYTYGYKRFSLLGSIFLSGVLTISSIFILVEAGKRVLNPQEVNEQGMLWLAIFGVVINGAAALRLKRGTSLNEKAIFLHIMEDVLGWVAVLVVSIVMQFYNAPILDPLLSIAISLWVLSNVYKNIKDVFTVLLQATPSSVNLQEFKQKVVNIPNVKSIQNLHIWSLDGETHVASLHINVVGNQTSDIKKTIRTISQSYNIEHTTIEVDDVDDALVNELT